MQMYSSITVGKSTDSRDGHELRSMHIMHYSNFWDFETINVFIPSTYYTASAGRCIVAPIFNSSSWVKPRNSDVIDSTNIA